MGPKVHEVCKSKTSTKDQKKKQLKKGRPQSDDEEQEEVFDQEDDDEENYETCSDDDEEDEEEEEDTDSTYTPPKKQKKTLYRNGNRVKSSKKIREEEEDDEDECSETEDECSGSGDDGSGSEDEDEGEYEDDDNESTDVKPHELRKTIAALFPSNYINQKVKRDEAESRSKRPSSSQKNQSKHYKTRRPAKKQQEDDEEEEEDEYEEEEDLQAAKDFSIFFTALGGGREEEEEAAIQDEADADEEYNSEDEKNFMKETYEEIVLPPTLNHIVKKPAKHTSSDPSKRTKRSKDSKDGKDSKDSKEVGSSKKKVAKKNTSEKSAESKDEATVQAEIESEYQELVDLKKDLLVQLSKKPKSKILLNAIEECRTSIKKLVKKTRMKNAKKYYKMVNGEDDKPTSEIDYFKKKLSHKEQNRVMRELKEINEHVTVKKPYRLTLLDSSIPAKYKATVMQKLNMLKSMEPGDPEYYKLKTWVDTFMRVPYSVYKNLNVNISDGVEKCSEFMGNAKQILDDCVYGLDDAKMQILQMVGQWVTNPSAMGSAIAIKGPPGTGKTSLVREGISKILGREFSFIALGGTGDASFLEGHSYTYEGSMWGKIVQILIDSKCMNPVIFFDELDKVSDTPRGEEIIGVLTHLTDTTQNSQFHDKYFSEVDFDLSKCLFIFSYNDENKVNPILRDRMYRIQTKGYDAKEKLIIARQFLLPKIREQVSFAETDVIIPDSTLEFIITNTGMTKSEDGVRNLKRCLEIIHTKLNLFRLMKPGENLFAKDMNLKVEFPFTVSKKDAEVLIKNEESQNQSLLSMYI